jgi:imidazolonepropionase-like amidohydrolase
MADLRAEQRRGDTIVPHEFVLRHVNVLDETGGFEGPRDVRVKDGIVAEVGSALANDGTSYDLDGLFLMPGMFDCHAHLGLFTLDMLEAMRTPISRWALEAAKTARVVLESGVTFVRDAGGIDAGIRDAIRDNLTVGPRAQIAIVMLGQTGGHSDGFLYGPGLEVSTGYIFPEYPGRPRYRVDGVDAMRETVRRVLRAGADWVKLATTGGFLSPLDDPRAPELTPEEIQVAVYEAARKGKSVLAHAMGGEGVDNAISAGVRSIEHGVFLSEAQAHSMANADCFLVPTLAIAHDGLRLAEAGKLPPVSAQKALGIRDIIGDCVQIARQAGVKIATGADFVSREQHGRNLEEIFLLRKCGLTASEALLAATINGAELCGVDDRYGRIAPGYVFDAILLDEEPSGNLSVFERPGAATGVFQGGQPIVSHPRIAAATSAAST